MLRLCLLLALAAPLAGESAAEQARARNEAGVAHYDRAEFAQAIRCFQEALALAPELEDVRTNLGKSHSALGIAILEEGLKRGPATETYRRALEQLRIGALHWAGDHHALHIAAFCHMRLGEYGAALQALDRALALAPGESGLWRLRAHVCDCADRMDEAEASYLRALALCPEDPEMLVRLERLRSDRRALSEFRRVESARFRICHPAQIPAATVEELRAVLESFSSALAERWAIGPLPQTTVICYAPGEFASSTGIHAEVGGAFDGRIRIPFPAEIERGGLRLEQVLEHEVVHLLLRRCGEAPPRWVDEGLAQLLDGDAREDWKEPWRKLVRSEPRVGLLQRLGRFREEVPETWGPLYQHSFYFFLHLRELGGEFRLDMLVREAVRRESWDEAFVAVYGASPAELDRAWRAKLVAESLDPPAPPRRD